MLFPIRCFTCGKVLGDKWDEYKKRVDAGEAPSKILDDLGVKRYCCRRMFISYVEIMDEVLKFTVYKAENIGEKIGGES
ncbi:DNA-directed RNA polymerase subunit N [Candidatus Marsarchaeota G2 archaeon OSP_D]|uniref:DNA-directed RNA polymerase subunit Rpo10 n=5 Tax=Candidatus Marsarchaeota group 2 TaxID=2203771 RepID=A0A2R6CEN6_9ARCH|nr:MAG: DNA-directed RNA polymerase subunit N [Candidatus Marsarchaeota G2 archaeon OSP_D]PSN96789.1 MAG: DNA-directed RNA polymerase subunit N [Candidatus Marsarchaeota G2 archaeon ECH_B_2]PSO01358.1 MAG: DNA-directed RNA polymerase subunit N [Candidatus Marsarchaeota G2 archaeon ECH_B_3]PSO03490.1 MAG: DNA-directed RNA polymerase subunit N [Candidatus Marsarchaeota G2 archaeon ECH_B_1]PSO09301.1 MAG: DNA-directed RNA polymerase subunit N [Candidatus Marsarchaeota G2 archaeon BE_D]